MRLRALLAVVLCGLLVGVASRSLAYTRPGRTHWVSVAASGGFPSSFSNAPSLSRDGRYVSFYSDSSDIVSGDSNGFGDVFVRDMVAGTTELISVAQDGGPSNGGGSTSEISEDGRYVAFWSSSTNLVPGDGNGKFDIFVRDRLAGTTERVSVSSDGKEGNGHSNGEISMSADARYVAFESFANNFVPGDTNGDPDVFIHDRQENVTTLVSRATGGAVANQASQEGDLSADGRFVAFMSAATNLAPGDSDELVGGRESDIFVRDMEAGVTERVSVASDGSRANVGSLYPSISGDGRYVAFYTPASNLVPDDGNGLRDVFVHDRDTGVTERVSVASDGAGGNSTSILPAISADGRLVTFESSATNLVPGDTNANPDIFVHDRLTGLTERVSVGTDGTEADSFSVWQAISADGQHIAFATFASNLVPGDTNGVTDVFTRYLGPRVGVGGLEASGTGDRSVGGWATFAGRVLTSATDARGDAAPGGAEAGADLTEAVVVHRPEQEDLLVRLDVTRLPGVRWPYLGIGEDAEDPPFLPAAGAPGVLYGMELRAGGVRYEVRVLRGSVTAVPPAAPYFALYRCEPACMEVARLAGGYGQAREGVSVSVPLSALGAVENVPVTGVRAFTALGEAGAGSVRLLDEVSLPDATLLTPTVTLGMAPPGTPEDEVVFDTPAELAGGSFTGSPEASALAAGEHDVWARACLGETCGSMSVRVAP